MNSQKHLGAMVCTFLISTLTSGCIMSHDVEHDHETYKATIHLHYSPLTDTSTITRDTLFIIGPHGSHLIDRIEKRINNHVVITTHPLTRNKFYKLVSSSGSEGIKYINGSELIEHVYYITHAGLVAKHSLESAL